MEEEVGAIEKNGTQKVLLGPPDNSHLQKTKLCHNSPTTSAKYETDSFLLLSLNSAKSELMEIFDKIQREVNREFSWYSLLILLFAGWSWNEQRWGRGSGGRGRVGTSKADRARAMKKWQVWIKIMTILLCVKGPDYRCHFLYHFLRLILWNLVSEDALQIIWNRSDPMSPQEIHPSFSLPVDHWFVVLDVLFFKE